MASGVSFEKIDFVNLVKIWNEQYKDTTPQQKKTEKIVQPRIPKHLSSSPQQPPNKPLPPLPPMKKSQSTSSIITRNRSASSPVRMIQTPLSSSSSPLQRKESKPQIDPKEALKEKVEQSYKKIRTLTSQQNELIETVQKLLTQSKDLLDMKTMLSLYQTQEKIITQVKEGNHLIYGHLEKSCLLDSRYSKKAKKRDNRFEECMGKIADFIFEMRGLLSVLKDSKNLLMVGTNASPQNEITDAMTTFFSNVKGELLLNQFAQWKTSYTYDASFNEEIMTNLSHYFDCVFTLIESYIKYIGGKGSISIKKKRKEEVRIKTFDYMGREFSKEAKDVICTIPRQIAQYVGIFKELIKAENSLIKWRESHLFPIQIEKILKEKFIDLSKKIDTQQSELNELLKEEK